MKLTDEQRNDEVVKSLLDSGFTEDLIADWIKSGAIEFSKSVDDDDDDDDDDDNPDNPPADGGDPNDDENGGDDDDDKKKGIKKGCGKKSNASDGNPDELAKSISDSLMKSFDQKIREEVSASSEELLKSLPTTIEEALRPTIEKIEKSLEGFRKAIELFGSQAPSFKSAGVNLPFLEKSIGMKDADDKTILSVSRNREVVRAIISKSIEEEKDEAIRKSLVENTNAYILDPVEGAIGEVAARYLYDKKNIRLVD